MTAFFTELREQVPDVKPGALSASLHAVTVPLCPAAPAQPIELMAPKRRMRSTAWTAELGAKLREWPNREQEAA